MAKASKSTKKFMKKNPEKRPKGPRGSFKRKREKVAADAAAAADEARDDAASKKIEEMDIDEFLSGGFMQADADTDAAASDDDASGSDDSHPAVSDLDASDDDNDADIGDFHSPAGGDENLSDSDDEEAEGDAKDGITAHNRQLKGEIASHMAQLDKLKEADPEFYAYLQATDKELLAFGGSDDEQEDDSDDDDAASEGDADAEAGKEEDDTDQPPAAPAPQYTVTLAMVDTWCKAALNTASPGALRHIIKAYRVACHYGDSEEQVEEGLRIGSSAVYNKLMLFVLKEVDDVFRRVLEVEGKTVVAGELKKLPRWKKGEPLIKSYLGNTLNLLSQMTDPAMLAFILRRIRASVVFLAPYDKLQRRYLKQALQLFGSAEPGPRVQAILLVRQMALTLPQPALDNCLKGVYRAFSINSKFINAASVPHINFMAASVVELYGLDPGAAYQHAFAFIRQLALLLRTALSSKTKDAFREVYCWQTVNCLELWAKVLAAHADQADLKQLVYPVSQLLLGTARLVPTPSYFPLRLRCALALNRLGQATGVFMPVAPLLLEILQWSDLSKAPKPAPAGRPVEPLLQLRAGKALLRASSYQEEIINQVFEQLADHLGQWACHVAFPELAHLPLVRLRKFVKTTPVERFRRGAKQLVDAIERNVAFVGKARDAVEFSPKDIGQVGSFLAGEAAAQAAPLQRYAAGLAEKAKARLQARMAQDLLLDAAANGKKGAKRVADDSEESGSDEEHEVAAPAGDVLAAAAAVKKQQAAGAAAANGVPAAKKAKRGTAAPADSDEEWEAGRQEDVVKAYELSSDEDEERDHRSPAAAFSDSDLEGASDEDLERVEEGESASESDEDVVPASDDEDAGTGEESGEESEEDEEFDAAAARPGSQQRGQGGRGGGFLSRGGGRGFISDRGGGRGRFSAGRSDRGGGRGGGFRGRGGDRGGFGRGDRDRDGGGGGGRGRGFGGRGGGRGGDRGGRGRGGDRGRSSGRGGGRGRGRF